MNTLDLITYATLIGATACACVIGVRDSVRPAAQQAETVVQAIVQLMQAVLAAENESLMEAIRA